MPPLLSGACPNIATKAPSTASETLPTTAAATTRRQPVAAPISLTPRAWGRSGPPDREGVAAGPARECCRPARAPPTLLGPVAAPPPLGAVARGATVVDPTSQKPCPPCRDRHRPSSRADVQHIPPPPPWRPLAAKRRGGDPTMRRQRVRCSLALWVLRDGSSSPLRPRRRSAASAHRAATKAAPVGVCKAPRWRGAAGVPHGDHHHCYSTCRRAQGSAQGNAGRCSAGKVAQS